MKSPDLTHEELSLQEVFKESMKEVKKEVFALCTLFGPPLVAIPVSIQISNSHEDIANILLFGLLSLSTAAATYLMHKGIK